METAKLFISYSHKDESLKDHLLEHMKSLEHTGHVTSWHDRKILAGQEWNEKISSHLLDADVILLLVSSSFVSSHYCYGKELATAIDRHKTGRSLVIPVALRECRWDGLPFAAIQAVPRDKQPIAPSTEIDRKFTEVIDALHSAIVAFSPRQGEPISATHTEHADEGERRTQQWLHDPSIELRHPRKDPVTLFDLYVPPDLKSLDTAVSGENSDLIRQPLAIASPAEATHTLILTDEQLGGTSLFKYLFQHLSDHDHPVWYIDATHINSSRVPQTEGYSANLISAPSTEFPTILLDNFHLLRLNSEAKTRLLTRLERDARQLIILAFSSVRFNAPEMDRFEGYSHYEICPFGHQKREQLIEKWLSLGREETYPESQLHRELDHTKRRLDALVRDHIVPSKPLFLVSILQTLETMGPSKLQLTSYGHCYQYLIYQAMEKASVPANEIDSHLNVLTELAHSMFERRRKTFDDEDTKEFCRNYNASYLGTTGERAIQRLCGCGILTGSPDGITFRYRYVYYFFAAKKLAEALSQQHGKILAPLINKLHLEEYANIVVFTAHHAKDPTILDEIQIEVLNQFPEKAEATLGKQEISFMGEFLNHIPKLVMEQRNIREERLKVNSRLDEAETTQSQNSELADEQTVDSDQFLKRLIKTVRGIEILGEIIRNRHGSLRKEVTKEIADTAISASFGFLTTFLHIVEEYEDDIVKIIHEYLREDPEVSNEDITEHASKAFRIVAFGTLSAALKKTAHSLGCPEAMSVFRELDDKRGTPASGALMVHLELSYGVGVNIERLRDLYARLQGNPVMQRVFAEAIVSHLYLHDVPYRKKGQISSHFDIPMKKQETISRERRLRR